MHDSLKRTMQTTLIQPSAFANSYAPRPGPTCIPKALLDYLREHSERVISRQELASGVWRLQLDVRSRVIDQTVSQLRKMLEPQERILTVRGIGYQHHRVSRNGTEADRCAEAELKPEPPCSAGRPHAAAKPTPSTPSLPA